MSQTYAAVQAVLNRELQEPLAELIARSNPALAGITKKGVASDAIYLKAAASSNHDPGPIIDGADVTFTGNERTNFINPRLDWTTYIAKWSVPKRLLAQVANNPGSIGSLLRYEIEQAAKDLVDRLSNDLFGGVTPNGLVGLQAIASASNTYAGVDRSLAANANWRSVVVDASPNGTATGELSTGLLYRMDEEYFNRNKVGFDMNPFQFTGITSSRIMTKYKAMMENIDLSSLATAHFVNQANNSGQLGIGKTGFMGIPFMRDAAMSIPPADLANSGRLYIADMSKLHLCVLTPSGDKDVHQVQGYESAPTIDGITPKIEILGNLGESVRGYVKVYVQLATSDPAKAVCVLRNIDAD